MAWARSHWNPRFVGRLLPRQVPPRTASRFKTGSSTQRLQLPETPCRTRFAPSPTGFLHLGSLRTALYNYLLAKKTGGQFVLRLEDTDQKRTVQAAEERLYRDLEWAGLEWDEGPVNGGPFGPYRQSERTPIYQDHAHKLVKTGSAYRCFCSQERLVSLAQHRQSLGLPTNYDRQCAGIPKDESDERASKGESHVIRLKAPKKYPSAVDLLYGPVTTQPGLVFKHGESAYDDPILLKGDGQPTYHLANVVDDHLMDITHVIRAVEWMPSTPKHQALYQAFGWEAPKFLHVGLLVDENGQKLSKRNFATDVQSYRDMGIFPQALVNFTALLGWSHRNETDLMTMPQLIDHFHLRFTKGNAALHMAKLWFLQGGHAKLATAEARHQPNDTFQQMREGLLEVAQRFPPSDRILKGRSLQDYVDQILALDAQNYTLPQDYYERNMGFFHELDESSREVYEEKYDIPTEDTMAAARWILCDSDDYGHTAIDQRIKLCSEELAASKEEEKFRNRETYRYLRWVLFLGRPGPSITHAMELLGPEICRGRLEAAEASLQGAKPKGLSSSPTFTRAN